MKRPAIFSTLFLLHGALFFGCKSTSPAPAVPVIGSSSARARLAGRWEGTYRSAASGRSGTIVFEFEGEVGHGDVLMMPQGSSEPVHPAHPESSAQTQSTAKAESVDETLRRMQVLKIRFVETSEGALTGVLDPYVDPDCLCEVQTSFNGVIRGDQIEGSFTSRPVAGGSETTGQWSVKRKK